jgi:hypothetical protein
MTEEVGFFDLIVLWKPLGQCLLYKKYAFLEVNQTAHQKLSLKGLAQAFRLYDFGTIL